MAQAIGRTEYFAESEALMPSVVALWEKLGVAPRDRQEHVEALQISINVSLSFF